MKVSVLILTQNNENFITNCLKSVSGWAGEIVIIDGGSIDKTLEICRLYKSKVFHNKWQGFSSQRNFAAKKATSDWIFYLDADERMTRSLKKEIDNLRPSKNIFAFQVKRQNYILGKFLRKGGWYPDLQTRLINKNELIKWQGKLHEYPKIKGKMGKLKGSIIHLTHRGINWCLRKTINYTDLEAALLFQANHSKVKWWNFITAGFREFWQRGIIKQGLTEGMEGFIAVVYQVFNAFIIYVKLWQLQKKESMEKIYKKLDSQLLEKEEY
ncbi:hypothetical protein COT75_01745 [Candidatus Beckwithbacteria bacterium CG10_big_fil_rev_8_21_14_0_10_34_10]|uniref:Glycosyltransferase 2-like domain-containing protein n=1 Tax=Candidatus Beckwithbacteria bacterium CG10_big_fil_rev_8_21_14_0_10_34_10 TaxID=1974495 RepID=A0A2H0W9P7_9BACT|nr:MAG: hypothetical protein COT75_01745 [Candidatus Beckwithbacteria bacterium CG10_big_fil_rev_8_21_14_0_10_34_10]